MSLLDIYLYVSELLQILDQAFLWFWEEDCRLGIKLLFEGVGPFLFCSAASLIGAGAILATLTPCLRFFDWATLIYEAFLVLATWDAFADKFVDDFCNYEFTARLPPKTSSLPSTAPWFIKLDYAYWNLSPVAAAAFTDALIGTLAGIVPNFEPLGLTGAALGPSSGGWQFWQPVHLHWSVHGTPN